MSESSARPAMGSEEFERLAKAIVHHGPGWQSRIALHLGVHRSSISRWTAGVFSVPRDIADRLRRDAGT